MAKAFDPRAKAKRQKIVAGVLGLVLVGVLIFQAPTILGMFGGSSSATASEPVATTQPTPVATPAPTTPGVPAAPAPGTSTGSASLVDSDPAPTATDGQLVSFDRFESKDPFVQQLDDTPNGQASSPSVPAITGAKTKDPDQDGANEQPAPQPTPATDEATMSVNGVKQEVPIGGTFPADDPIFKLVSVGKRTAKIGIVGGSYANGSQTITLTKGGKPVTLMNTADGTTYVLRYLG